MNETPRDQGNDRASDRRGERKGGNRGEGRGPRPASGDRDRRGGSGDRDKRGGSDDRPRRPRGGREDRAGRPRDRDGRPRQDTVTHEQRAPRPPEPEIAEDVTFSQLDRDVRARLRGLTKDHAEYVGKHLIMAGRLLDVDPERSYEHAQAAVRGAGRIDIVREAAGIAAYRTNRFAEALRELRTVRRLNGSSEHLPIMADSERGLGRPERALALAASDEAATLDAPGRIELAIVASGARSDLGEHDAALAVLDKISAADATGDLALRVVQARAVALEVAGQSDAAAALLASVDSAALERAIGATQPVEDITVFDVEEDAALAEEEYVADHPEELDHAEEPEAGTTAVGQEKE